MSLDELNFDTFGRSFDTFEKSVYEHVEKMSQPQQAHFAWICTVRALPFLCNRNQFSFWGKDKQTHLYSIFYALDACASYNINYDSMATYAASAYDDIDAIHDAYRAINNSLDNLSAEYVVRAVYYAVVTAALADAPDAPFGAPAGAATAAVIAAHYISRDLLEYFLKEIFYILRTINDNNSTLILSDTSIYGSLWQSFLADLSEIGCSYWANQYKELFDNNFVPNKKEIILRLQVPDAVHQEGAATVAKHMEGLAEQGFVETKEARIILLGTKGAGKTSLARKLRNPIAPMPRKSASTAGVDTSKLKLISNETTHLWDFGGHVIAQAAHKCFVSAECVYVLVIDGRTEQQLDIDEHRKWLSTVKTYSGGRAKVFVLLNTSDGHNRKMPEKKLREEFPDLIEDFYTCNIRKDKQGLHDFKEDIKRYIETNFVRKLPALYFDVKKELERQFRELKKETLDEEEVNKIVSELGLKDGSHYVLDYLNILGVALRYDNIPNIVLNPTWISNGIYTIINHMQNSNLIEMHLDDMPKVFKGKETSRYNADNCNLLYELMVKYELAFQMKNRRNTLLVPAVLPDDEPDDLLSPKDKEETLARKYHFDITLADNVFPRYIQRNHEYIMQSENGDYIVWYSGMLLANDNTNAKITKKIRMIEITTWGENRSDLLHKLHNELGELLEEHRLQWEKDEIKLPTGYVATDVIRQLHNDGTSEYGGSETETIMKQYRLSLISVDEVNVLSPKTLSPEVSIDGLSRKPKIPKLRK